MRTKWLKRDEIGPRPNELVMIKDETLPPTQWQMARVKRTYQGGDDLTRVVLLKTANNEIKRPITKICPLPINKNDIEVNANLAKIARSRSKSVNVLPIVIAFLTWCVSSTHQSAILKKPYDISKFETAPGLYFEKMNDVFMSHSRWNVLFTFNVQVLGDELKLIKANRSSAQGACYRKARVEGGCRQLIDHLKTKLDNLA